MKPLPETEFGINEVAAKIHNRLQRYLEAQYHIRDEQLIEERKLLLAEPRAISQRPFVEVTPSYAVGASFSKLHVPHVVRELLQELQGWGIGVFPPYQHQAEALEKFFRDEHDGDDLIIATGTGSGKTETFLNTILGSLALEASERRASFRLDGVRALLLYPMNALVSDQTARLRRLLGHQPLAELFRERWGRHIRFGMYTSRTPYPGVRHGNKDERHIAPVLKYFTDLEDSGDAHDQRLVAKLRERGRWPAKNLAAFFGRSMEEHRAYKSGKRAAAGKHYIRRNWDQRLVTQPDDRELLTRHEMQTHTPDLLVTNYSMLEYMLLRPIERTIFAQTRDWLAFDDKNQLLLILDEAHMYRGVAGAEVGLLLRRLQSRLGITRDRLRCILTSASLRSDATAEHAVLSFARGLAGERAGKPYSLIRGAREPRAGASPGSDGTALALARVDPTVLAAAARDPAKAHSCIADVAAALGWSTTVPDDDAMLRQYTARQLTGFGPLELAIQRCAANAVRFEDLSSVLFPTATDRDVAARATDGLLALGCFARRWEPGREEQPLLPARVHVFFRGLPPVFACVNPACSARRHMPSESALLGRLFTEPRTACGCGARVFELFTHRDCGAAFLRVFSRGPDADFLWHERGGVLTGFGQPLHEIHLLVEEPNPRMLHAVQHVWLDAETGRLYRRPPPDASGMRLCYRPADPDDSEVGVSTFRACPICTRRTRTGRTLKIMDLSTKGEQPFANLIREQFVCQVATRALDDTYPNGGRKALLFSDGRQKAARLARDLPREVERDSFREALVAAVSLLRGLERDTTLDESLYAAFVAICTKYHLHFFERADQEQLLEECARFRTDYASDLALALDEGWKPTPTIRYRQALLRQLADPYYSLVAACAAVVEPRPNKLRLIDRRLATLSLGMAVTEITKAFVREMLRRSAFDPELSIDARQDEFMFFDAVKSDDGIKAFFADTAERARLTPEITSRIREALFEVLTREGIHGPESGRLLVADAVVIALAIDDTWLQCSACGHVQLQAYFGSCETCGTPSLEKRPPSHPYMVARKGFFRDPLRAVLAGARPVHVTAEEHTAQLSQRDGGVVYATTEEFELRFQDVPLGPKKPPVDILSCTTTMEVGIDIGALTAVGLRTVPPQRENYQQRAGRAGRRGTSVSTVLTFAQGGAHDAYYFANPHVMISGFPREPKIKSDNRRLARRHIHSHLFQTFFHEQIDRLSEEELRALVASRPNIMSAFGSAAEFFQVPGDFSFTAFERWISSSVLVPKSAFIEDVATWLPDELAYGSEVMAEKRSFAREVASELVQRIRILGSDPRAQATATDDSDEGEDSVEGDALLDLLFDHGILPSYAFPTDLCSFVIHERDDRNGVRVKERPQLSKAQALSEYAPGRLLVVNKLTYRVGGIYVEGPPTGSPASSLFARPLTRYVGCDLCSFVRLETGAEVTPDGTPCPVCKEPLRSRELLDPPAMSPERGAALKESDRKQEITYASSAQLPELVERDQFKWQEGAGSRLRHAYGEDVLLVVANKGKESKGFVVCESCGGAWLSGQEPADAHRRPFVLPPKVFAREHLSQQCNGALRKGLFLGYQFRTDILLLRILFASPLDFNPEHRWLYDALATLAEAVALGASRHLDIDPGEVSAGFRLMPGLAGEEGIAELYLFDTASGGAGYAAEAGEELDAVLKQTETLLADCPYCDRSCTKCLRHYGNRFLHGRLDRKLGLALLRFARNGEVPAIEPVKQQAERLGPLAKLLSLEGWDVLRASAETTEAPLLATDARSHQTLAIGTYPALLAKVVAEQIHPLADSSKVSVLLPDYLVSRDLPSAYQVVVSGSRSRLRNSPAAPTRPATEIPVRELPMMIAGVTSSARTVRLATNARDGTYAVQVPSAALARAGVQHRAWLVLKPTTGAETESERVLLGRRNGTFKATGEGWTIAFLRRLVDADGERIQVSYGRPEREFRPERVASADIAVLGAVVEVLDSAETT